MVLLNTNTCPALQQTIPAIVSCRLSSQLHRSHVCGQDKDSLEEFLTCR